MSKKHGCRVLKELGVEMKCMGIAWRWLQCSRDLPCDALEGTSTCENRRVTFSNDITSSLLAVDYACYYTQSVSRSPFSLSLNHPSFVPHFVLPQQFLLPLHS